MSIVVYCDPELPADWDEREQRLAIERQVELVQRDPQFFEPEVVTMLRRAALL